MSVCAFTGHRILTDDYDPDLLKKIIINLAKHGTKKFLCGMAVGFDLEAAKIVLSLKKKYKTELIACLPCANQAERFSEKNREQYEEILSKCDDKIILAPTYTSGCMHARNRYLVDNCDVVVCFLRKNAGGTYYTVSYARRQGKKIIEL